MNEHMEEKDPKYACQTQQLLMHFIYLLYIYTDQPLNNQTTGEIK